MEVILRGSEIRAAMLAQIKSAAIVPDAQVYDTRTIPIPVGATLPIIIVYQQTAAPDRESLTSQIYRTVYTMTAQAIVTATTDEGLAAALDTIEAQITHALLDEPGWADDYDFMAWTGTERDLSWEADKRRAAVAVRIAVTAVDVFSPTGFGPLNETHTTVEVEGGTDHTPPFTWEAP